MNEPTSIACEWCNRKHDVNFLCDPARSLLKGVRRHAEGVSRHQIPVQESREAAGGKREN